MGRSLQQGDCVSFEYDVARGKVSVQLNGVGAAAGEKPWVFTGVSEESGIRPATRFRNATARCVCCTCDASLLLASVRVLRYVAGATRVPP